MYFDALREAIPGWKAHSGRSEYVIGVLRGEGVGPEVVQASLDVLHAAEAKSGVSFKIQEGGLIGNQAVKQSGKPLTGEVIDFCHKVFSQDGAVFCGPGGDRFVYELRRELDLYCKLTPILPIPVLGDTGVIKPTTREDVDILLVREIAGGVYLGQWESGDGRASHRFSYDSMQVERILRIAIALANARKQRLSVVLKPGGVPSISELWVKVLESCSKPAGLEIQVLEVDNAAFQLIQTARNFDVVVSPNMFGDIIADVGGLLHGSRGLCYSGNYGRNGMTVYNTGHGAAYDLAGKDVANPLGMILTMSMLVRVSFGLSELAARIEKAVETTLRAGWRTADIAAAGCTIVGTKELTRRVVHALEHPAPLER
jgi:3-isopropylmalate dehydrogenase